jgi:membrane carboxypeptidase/penicillin-binding protein
MMAAHDSLPYLDFPEPVGIIHAYICTETGELATDRCPVVRSEVFTEETQPTGLCSKHLSKRLYNPGTDNRSDSTDTSNKPRMRF